MELNTACVAMITRYVNKKDIEWVAVHHEVFQIVIKNKITVSIYEQRYQLVEYWMIPALREFPVRCKQFFLKSIVNEM